MEPKSSPHAAVRGRVEIRKPGLSSLIAASGSALWVPAGMKPIQVGLVADPALPTDIAHRIGDLDPPGDGHRAPWDIEVVSEPFTLGCEDVDTAMERLEDEVRKHEWDLVVGLTELPLRDDDGRYLLVEADPQRKRAVLSLPALGGFRLHARTRHAVRTLVDGMTDRSTHDEHRVPLPRIGGRWRLLLGMVLANRPWLLVPGLKSALVAALATGAVATINSTVWLLADSMSWWRLVVATIASITLVVAWLVIDGELGTIRTTAHPRLGSDLGSTTHRR